MPNCSLEWVCCLSSSSCQLLWPVYPVCDPARGSLAAQRPDVVILAHVAWAQVSWLLPTPVLRHVRWALRRYHQGVLFPCSEGFLNALQTSLNWASPACGETASGRLLGDMLLRTGGVSWRGKMAMVLARKLAVAGVYLLLWAAGLVTLAMLVFATV